MNRASLYPFMTQTILANSLIKDFKILVPKTCSQLWISEIRTQYNYLFIKVSATILVQGKLQLFYGIFQTNGQLQVQLESQHQDISGKLLLYQLPKTADYYVYMTESVEYDRADDKAILHPATIIRYEPKISQVHTINFTGLLQIQEIEANKFKIYRRNNPGYQLNNSLASDNRLILQDKPIIQQINNFKTTRALYLCFDAKSGLYQKLGINAQGSRVDLYINVAEKAQEQIYADR